MPIRWRSRSPDQAAVATLARRRDLPELVAALLVSRGHADPNAAEVHLAASPRQLHDPFLLDGMERACVRLVKAIEAEETILVHGDYDVDGVTGTVLLVRALRLLGAKVRWHIPNRLVDGYSFGLHSIARAEELGATLVISVDNGTSAHEVIAALASRGIDTIVTDHHEPPAGPLPRATAIVNPKLAGSRYPWRELCGGAVAFKLAWGLAKHMNGGARSSEDLKRFLEDATAYVAIATICDVVPMIDENRVFARYGLKALESTRNPGLSALVEIAGLSGRTLAAQDVAFQIGPRLNASGRLGSADRAVELLLSEDDATARALAPELETLNQRRKEIELVVLAAAREQARRYTDATAHPVLVLAGQGWHQGVVGIVAARISEEYGRPTLVIGLDGDAGRGSARSIAGFSVLDALSGAAAHFERYGGHSQAAGCEVKSCAIESVREAMESKARTMLDGQVHPEQELLIDYDLPFPEMTPSLMKRIDLLEPFGAQNEEPILLSRDLRLAEPPRVVGNDKSHLMLQLRHGSHVLKAMAFRQASRASELRMGAAFDVVYTPKWNVFRGETNLELVIKDFLAAKTC